MIEVKNLTKCFDKNKVLDDLNIHVRKASVYGLLGPNGAGKTTLIKHLTGLYRQDQGTVTIDHKPVYENPEVKAQMVYIPDDLYFFSQYSIDETAKFYAKIYPKWNWNRYEQLKQVFPIDSKKLKGYLRELENNQIQSDLTGSVSWSLGRKLVRSIFGFKLNGRLVPSEFILSDC
ncbi:ATP-binding cassette domain-containing protein [Dehalobacter sp. 4CP]|uniref:ATP-binding cassette domain-containing protein n=1 Tax=Dehalobacter sp. CP TaxID=2594474 RepID=UPI0039ED90A9